MLQYEDPEQDALKRKVPAAGMPIAPQSGGVTTPQPDRPAVQPQTFATMQRNGQARPAPPPPGGVQVQQPQMPVSLAPPTAPPVAPPTGGVPGTPTPGLAPGQAPAPVPGGQPYVPPAPYDPSMFGGGGWSGVTNTRTATGGSQHPTTGFDSEIEALIRQSMAQPTGFDDAALKAAFDRLALGIDDEYSMRDTALREEMAARGLADSSIQGGRLSDLNVAKRSAKVDLGERLATEAARALTEGRQAALGSAMNYRGQNRDYDLALQQLGIDEAALAANTGLGYARINSDAARTAAELNQRSSEFGAEFGEGQRRFDVGAQGDAEDRSERQRQFDATYGLDRYQFDRNFGQRQYEFDEGLGFQRDQLSQQGLNDLLRYLFGGELATYDY